MKLLVALILFNVSLNTSSAQDSLEVAEVKKIFSQGLHTGYLIKIPQVNYKDVISDWKKYINQKNKIKLKEIGGEYFLDKTIISEISKDSIYIYSIINPKPDHVEFLNYVSGNNEEFYSAGSNSSLVENFKSFLRGFAINEYRNGITDELKSEQKKLTVLQQNLKDLENENIKSEKTIKANERDNERKKDDIKSNLNLQELKSSAISDQQKLVSTYDKSSDQKSEQEKKLKSLQKDKKKLEKENESIHLDIEENEDENKSIQKKIEKNNTELIPAKQEEIKKQLEIIAGVDAKLKNLK